MVLADLVVCHFDGRPYNGRVAAQYVNSCAKSLRAHIYFVHTSLPRGCCQGILARVQIACLPPPFCLHWELNHSNYRGTYRMQRRSVFRLYLRSVQPYELLVSRCCTVYIQYFTDSIVNKTGEAYTHHNGA
jgi:hypothetical protein